MRILILLISISISGLSFSQSKNEIIEGLRASEKQHLTTIDSLKFALNKVKNDLKKEQSVSKNQLDKITKLNFETADLRLVMYKYVASIDSLNLLTAEKERSFNNMEKNYNQCREDKKKLAQSLQTQSSVDDSPSDGTRKVVTDLNTSNLHSAEKATFKFLLYVDEYGMVTKVELVAKNSSNKELLEKVSSEIKKQVRYNSSLGAEPIGVYYTCKIEPR